MLDRSTAPMHQTIKSVAVQKPQINVLQSGLPVYYLHTPGSGILKVDWVFNAGARFQKHPGVASAVGAMLTEGTSRYTSAQLADAFDSFGAYIQPKISADDSSLSLFCIPKHFKSCFDLVLHLLDASLFPQHELNLYKTNSIQRLKVNEQRNTFLARRAFYETVFGNKNPYGLPVNQVDYENISRETLFDFYQHLYGSGPTMLLLSGDVTDSVLHDISAYYNSRKFNQPVRNTLSLSPYTPQKIALKNPYSVQSTIKIGMPLFNRSHVDFLSFQFTNLLLGGFFGSRLMKKIREENGLTYGIYSAYESFWDSGAFYIETEMNSDLKDQGLDAIFKEIERLRKDPVSQQELDLVKNYMLGSFLRGLDGPFAVIDRYKTLLDYGQGYEYFDRFVNHISGITSEEVLRIANTYLNPESLTTIIVGQK